MTYYLTRSLQIIVPLLTLLTSAIPMFINDLFLNGVSLNEYTARYKSRSDRLLDNQLRSLLLVGQQYQAQLMFFGVRLPATNSIPRDNLLTFCMGLTPWGRQLNDMPFIEALIKQIIYQITKLMLVGRPQNKIILQAFIHSLNRPWPRGTFNIILSALIRGLQCVFFIPAIVFNNALSVLNLTTHLIISSVIFAGLILETLMYATILLINMPLYCYDGIRDLCSIIRNYPNDPPEEYIPEPVPPAQNNANPQENFSYAWLRNNIPVAGDRHEERQNDNNPEWTQQMFGIFNNRTALNTENPNNTNNQYRR